MSERKSTPWTRVEGPGWVIKPRGHQPAAVKSVRAGWAHRCTCWLLRLDPHGKALQPSPQLCTGAVVMPAGVTVLGPQRACQLNKHRLPRFALQYALLRLAYLHSCKPRQPGV